MKSTIFWDIIPCSPLKVNRRFEEIYRLHLQGQIIRGTKTIVKAGGKQEYQAELAIYFHAFFDLEDGGDLFLRNVGLLSREYTALFLRIPFITTAVRTSEPKTCGSVWVKIFWSDARLKGPYTINHVAQHCVLCNMIERVSAPLYQIRVLSREFQLG
jgi:hypothetical protein